MKFTINAVFCGFCGNKAVISQGRQARMVDYYNDVVRDLKESTCFVRTFTCDLDPDGSIWIREVSPVTVDDRDAE